MFDLVEIACLEQRGIHHSLDLPGESHDQFEATEEEADATNDHDRTNNNQQPDQLVIQSIKEDIKISSEIYYYFT